MKNKKLQGNLAMIGGKTLSGFNSNALKYLIPVWMSPFTGVTFRLAFGAIAFWITDFILSKYNKNNSEKHSFKDILYLIFLGVVCNFGFMAFYLSGLKYTTPISSSIILAMVPIWVLAISVLYYKEKLTILKIVGIIIGFGGVILSMSSKRDSSLASNALLGDILTLGCSIIYSIYLVIEKKLLKKFNNITILKWTFTGAALTAIIVNLVVGIDTHVFKEGIFSPPALALLFVLFGPTYFTYLLLPVGLKYLSPTVVSMYGYLIIVIASIVAYITGQDKFAWVQLFSIILLCASVYLVEKSESA
jgi:Permeases of the drug/metabolite transporter (DMT) superfamily